MNFFLAIVPPEPILSEVSAMKEEMRERFGSSQALNSPPHITLHMPFEWRDDKAKELLRPFRKAFSGFPAFEICLDGFGAFPPRVIFVKPMLTRKLSECYELTGVTARKELHILNQDRLGKPFHPHMTIAYRDLRKEQFSRAWPEMEGREYRRSFICSGVFILRKPGKVWEPFEEFAF